MTTVNLTALAEVCAKMTPGEYEVAGIFDRASRTTIKTPDFTIARLDIHPLDEALDEANASGLAAEHNAIGVLIEVALAVKVWASATMEVDDVAAAWSSLLVALAKVSL